LPRFALIERGHPDPGLSLRLASLLDALFASMSKEVVSREDEEKHTGPACGKAFAASASIITVQR